MSNIKEFGVWRIVSKHATKLFLKLVSHRTEIKKIHMHQKNQHPVKVVELKQSKAEQYQTKTAGKISEITYLFILFM